jgi:SAM-dependent methyltransferase
MAGQYLASKAPLDDDQERLLTALLAGSDADAPVLDLGCGAGVPVTRWLAARRTVVGVDLSLRQLALARRHIPGAHLIQADMTEIDFPDAAFGAVVSLYAIIHVPREGHQALLQRVYRWLRPGGGFLATWPLGAWEGEEPDWSGWGASMWWSHFGRETNLSMIESAGFGIAAIEDRRGAERWLWVLARKPS